MAGKGEPTEIAGHTIKLVTRTPNDDAPCRPDEVDYNVVTGTAEELADLNEDEFAAADGQGRKEVRKVRPPERGLLLLYPIRHEGVSGGHVLSAAVSLPTSERARTLTYTVNEVYRQQELFALDDGDEPS